MKHILKYYSRNCQNQFLLSCLLRKLGLYECLVNFSCLFTELLTGISQIQQRILKYITLPQILCQYQNKLRNSRWKKFQNVGATNQQKIKVLQVFGLLFYKFAFCAFTCWSVKCHANRHGFREKLGNLLVTQWHEPGHQGALMMCPLVGFTQWGSPFLYPSRLLAHFETLKRLLRDLLSPAWSLTQVSPGFSFGEWGDIVVFFFRVKTLLNLYRSYTASVSTLTVFYLDMSILVYMGMPDQVFNLYQLQF